MDKYVVIKHKNAFDTLVKQHGIIHYYDIDIFAKKISELPLSELVYIVSGSDYEKFKQNCIEYGVLSFTFVIVNDASKANIKDKNVLTIIELKESNDNKILKIFGANTTCIVKRICSKELQFISEAIYNIVITYIPYSDICIELSLSTFAKNKKILFTSDDVPCLGHGGMNVSYDISKYVPDSIIRIPQNRKSFVANNYNLIKNYNDHNEKLFVNIKEIYADDNCAYLICEKLSPVKNIFGKDFNGIIDKLIQFVKKNPGCQYADLKYDNVMCDDKNRIVVSDIDIKIIYDSMLSKFAQNCNVPIPYDEIIKVNCNFDLAFQVLKKRGINVTSANVSIFLLNLIRNIGIRQYVVYTKELESKTLNSCNF